MITWIHAGRGRFVDLAANVRVEHRPDGDEFPWAVDEMHGEDLGATEVRRFAHLEDALDWARLTYGETASVRPAG